MEGIGPRWLGGVIGPILVTLAGCLGGVGEDDSQADEAPGTGAALNHELFWADDDKRVNDPYRKDGSQAARRTEPSVAINPTNPENVIIAAVDWNHFQLEPWYDRPTDSRSRDRLAVGIYVSDDGGTTWQENGFAPLVRPDGRNMTCEDRLGADPSVVFDGKGVAYLSFVSYMCPGQDTVAVQTSSNGGQEWNRPVVVQAVGAEVERNVCVKQMDKPYAGVDRANRIIYVTWTNVLGPCRESDEQWRGLVVYSSKTVDGGQTWTQPVRVSPLLEDFAEGSLPRVGSDGTVYVAYYHRTPYQTGDCPSAVNLVVFQELYTTEMVVARSTDFGENWTQHHVAKLCDSQFAAPEHPLGLGNSLPHPGFAIDENGTLFVAWADRQIPTVNVVFKSSRDGAETWSEPQVLTTSPGRGNFMPSLAYTANAVHMIYVSQSPTGLYDVMYRSSTDGVEWSTPLALNSAPMCACWGNLNEVEDDPVPWNFPLIGHYLGMDADGGKIVPAWPDLRDPLGAQTIYTRIGEFEVDGDFANETENSRA